MTLTYDLTPDMIDFAVERAFERLDSLPDAREAAHILHLLADLNVIRA